MKIRDLSIIAICVNIIAFAICAGLGSYGLAILNLALAVMNITLLKGVGDERF